MKISLMLLLFLNLMLNATENIPVTQNTGAVSSANASYDGTSLLLKGQVLLDHGLGKMSAEEATLQKQVVDSDFPFSFIHLQKQVHLLLSTHAELSCDSADFDFAELKGKLSSEEAVVYKDAVKNKTSKSSPFLLKGKTADLLFSKIEHPSQKPAYTIESLDMHQKVEVKYGKGFSLEADRALFHRKETQKKISTSCLNDKKCSLSHERDKVWADSMDLDVTHSTLSMVHPHGILNSFFVHQNPDAPVKFSSDSLIWDHLIHQISLRGNVRFEDPSLGILTSDQEIQIVQKGNYTSSLKGYGKTSLTYLSKHRLTSFGTLFIDQAQKVAVIESPLINGLTPINLQIKYEEENLTASADKGRMEYSENKGVFEPVSMTMQGHVQIASSDPSQPQKYGLADRAHYSHITHTLILFADPGKKVLFINEEDNLRLSAQEVHITQDSTSKKQTIQGIGNVQLSLTSEEEAKLKKIFKS